MRQVQQIRSRRSFIVLLLLFLAMMAAFASINSVFFRINKVTVVGNKYTPTDEVVNAAAIPANVNIFRVDTEAVAARLRHDLRFADATVARKFPNSLLITVTERQPLAYVAAGYGFVEIDKHGVVLAAYKNIKQMGVPMITGFRLANAYVGDSLTEDDLPNVLSYLAALSPDVLANLSEINMRDPHNLTAVTTNGLIIRLGDVAAVAEKAGLTESVLTELMRTKATAEYVDLSFSPPVIKFRRP